MKKKVLSSILSVVMCGMLMAGCALKTDSAKDTPVVADNVDNTEDDGVVSLLRR